MSRCSAAVLGALLLSAPGGARAEQPEPDRRPDADPVAEVEVGEVIVVTGTRTERPLEDSAVATEVVTRAEIEASGAENLAELLAQHPGVEVIPSFRGSAVRVQGMSPEYVLVLVDGRRSIGRVGGALDLERFPLDSIERVEVVKGASSALYGSDALGGVIQLVTRPVERPLEAEARVAYGSLGRLDASARGGMRRGPVGNRLTVGLHRGDALDLDPSDQATTASAYQEWSVEDRVTYERDRLEVAAGADYLRRDAAGVDVNAAGAHHDRRTVTEVGGGLARASWTPARGHRLHAGLDLSLLRDQYRVDQRGSDQGDTYEDTRQRLAELDLQYDAVIGRAHLITAGIEATDEQLTTPRVETEGDRQRLALFAQDEWVPRFSPLIMVLPGARVDLDSQFGSHLSPKLAVRFDPHERVVTRASYGRGFRAPDFRELYLRFENPAAGYRVEGNPELAPESSQSANLGVEVRGGERLWGSASAYYNDIDDLIGIELIPDGGDGQTMLYSYVNTASAFTRGLELRGRATLAGFSLDLGYAFLDSGDRDSGRPLPGRARHSGTVSLGWEHDAGLRALARGRVVGPRPFYQDGAGDGAVETIVADPHAAIDLRVAGDLGDALTLFAGIENLLDAGDHLYLPIPPRAFYAGATARH